MGRPRRLSRDLVGRGSSNQPAYAGRAPSFGIGTQPAAPLFAHGDCNADDGNASIGVNNNYPREPVLFKLTNGTVVAACEAHEVSGGNGDSGTSHFLFRKTIDNARTWSRCYSTAHDASFVAAADWINKGVWVQNWQTGRVHLFYTRTTGTAGVATDVASIFAMHSYSDDNLATFSTPLDRSAEFKPSGSGWWIAGPHRGVCIRNGAYAGRLVVPFVTRTTTDVSGTSYSQVMYSDDDFVSDVHLSGPNMGNAANDNSNEFWVVEYGTQGYLFGMCRVKNGKYRATTRSLDGGATWTDFVAQDGTGGTTLLGDSNVDCVIGDCQGSGACTPNGNIIYAAFPFDVTIRARMKVFRSTDGGVTFPTSIVVDDHRVAYSALECIDNSSLLIAWEQVSNGLAFNTNSQAQCQYIKQARIPDAAFTNPTARSYRYEFNEAGDGNAFSANGQQIKDRDGYGCDAAGNTTHAATQATGGGYTTDGAGVGIILALNLLNEAGQQATSGHALQMQPNVNHTIEIAGFRTTAQGIKYIWDDRNGDGAGAGSTMQVTTNAVGNKFRDSDSRNATIVTSLGSINDGNPHLLRMEFNWATALCSMFVDNVFQNSVAMSGSSSAKSLANLVLGALANGNNPLLYSGTTIRVTKGIRASGDYLTGSETKQTLDEFYDHTVTTPATSPSLVSGALLLLAATYDDGRAAGKDRYGAWDKGIFPPLPGDGYHAYRDIVGNRRFEAGLSESRAFWWDEDGTIGPHWHVSHGTAGATGYFGIAHANYGTALDAIQNTGVFTYSQQVCFIADTTHNQYIFDNITGSVSTPGMTILLVDSTHIQVILSDGTGTAIVNKTFTIPAVSFGATNWYHLAVTGDGSTLRLYWTAYPGGRASTTISAAQTQAFTSGTWAPGTFASTGALAIGARNDDNANTGCSWSVKNILLASTCLDSTALQARMDFGPAY